MKVGCFGCREELVPWLPKNCRLLRPEDAAEDLHYDLLFLADPVRLPGECTLSGRTILLPGGCHWKIIRQLRTEQIVTYGMSPRDTLTLSALEAPTLCLQRSLQRADGSWIDPREIPLKGLPVPAERFLPVLGLYLLLGDLPEAWKM